MNKRLIALFLSGAIGVLNISGVAMASMEREEIEINKDIESRNIVNSSWSSHYVKMGYHYKLMDNTNLSKNVDLTKNISREDFTEIVMNYLRVHMTEFKMNKIKSKNKYVEYIDTANKNILEATQLGIVSGVGYDSFAPYKNIDRESVATILSRVERLLDVCDNININPNPELRIFKDKDKISDWAIQGVADMVSVGAINGNDLGEFNPQGYTTREQAIKIMVELYDRK